ncbi:hypothetical protein [Lunatibacter salilacus]|uniref:hypothetical protein n=1 Tax=Lunatibacter salilacus TaxID=2483804 RepID=UPI00131BA5FE|nr:hypothetical protein [Lunatibacter salilacus]
MARPLHQKEAPTAESEGLLKMIESFGLTLESMHKNTDDPNLQRYFIVEVPDRETAQQVIDRLLQSEAIEGAYIKPPDELP